MYDNELFEIIKNNKVNFIHLYYGLKDKVRNIDMVNNTLEEKVDYFVRNILTYDSNGRIGVICKFSDMLFINSGVKVALVPHTSLEFKNKSGKGCQGWSVKACLVDEDYSGYMHLSMQYLWYDDNLGTVYVGDKLTQGTVQNVLTDNAEEISIDEYNNLMKNTQRGANGFGSSDVKH
jgi:dUTPase